MQQSPTGKTIEVVRGTPPHMGRCRHADCFKAIEWVRTVAGNKAMPVTHPLVVVRVHDRGDAPPVTVIEASASHFVTCVAASMFRRRRMPA